ncbi:hypothetical protein LLEC1_08092, partial [Akanthomyces lecanii]
RFLAGGFAWFGAWSALAGCAVYSGPVLFAFCRAMQGVGPALMLPNAVAILGRAYEAGSRRQNMVFSLFGATAPSGFVVGAVFSSLLAQRTWWPWAYWVMAVTCLLFAVLSVFAVPATVRDSAHEDGDDSLWQRVDLPGAAAGVSALILFNFAWNQGPVVGWTQPYTYAIMIVGILAFVVFVFIEKKAKYPLIPFGVLKLDSLFTLACIGAGWSSFGVFVLYTWNFVLQFRHQTPLLSSAQFSPVAISGLFAAVGTGIALSNLRPSSVMLVSMVAATIVLSRAMPRKHQGLAASLVNTFVNYSISIGLGFAGTVESNVNDGGLDVLRGFRGALYMSVGLAALGVILALLFCLAEHHRSAVSEKMERESADKLSSA